MVLLPCVRAVTSLKVGDLSLVFCAPARAGLAMFVVSDSAAAAIRTAMEESGVLGAAAELRRLYPGIRDFAHAQHCARIIAGWAAADKPRGEPHPLPVCSVIRPRGLPQ